MKGGQSNPPLTEWTGLLDGQRPTSAELKLQAPLSQAKKGGSGAFLGLGEDQRRYWIKTINNAQGQKVPVTEQIVGRAGALIGAPVCEVKTIELTSDFVGWEFKPGHQLMEGIAHASVHVEGSVDTGKLDHRLDDDNIRHHAYIYALFDWCWGGDIQGLLVAQREYQFFSHDHGWYLPPTGANWTIEELQNNVETPHELQKDESGITEEIFEEIAASLDAIHREILLPIIKTIPAEWPVTDNELEWVGFFLEKRASAVAQRLRQRFGRRP